MDQSELQELLMKVITLAGPELANIADPSQGGQGVSALLNKLQGATGGMGQQQQNQGGGGYGRGKRPEFWHKPKYSGQPPPPNFQNQGA